MWPDSATLGNILPGYGSFLPRNAEIAEFRNSGISEFPGDSEIMVNVRHDLERFRTIGRDTTRLGKIWQDSTIVGNMYQDLTRSCQIWQDLASFDNLWKDVARFGEILRYFPTYALTSPPRNSDAWESRNSRISESLNVQRIQKDQKPSSKNWADSGGDFESYGNLRQYPTRHGEIWKYVETFAKRFGKCDRTWYDMARFGNLARCGQMRRDFAIFAHIYINFLPLNSETRKFGNYGISELRNSRGIQKDRGTSDRTWQDLARFVKIRQDMERFSTIWQF